MPYKLTTEDLNRYLCHRLKPSIEGQTHHLIIAELYDNRKGIALTDNRGKGKYRFVISNSFIPFQMPEYDKIEMAMEVVHKPGVNDKDAESFLEQMMVNDRIFQRGEPLFGHSAHPETLRREAHRENTMICSIIDRKAGTNRLRKAIFETMFRPWIYYVLMESGKYSKE